MKKALVFVFSCILALSACSSTEESKSCQAGACTAACHSAWAGFDKLADDIKAARAQHDPNYKPD